MSIGRRTVLLGLAPAAVTGCAKPGSAVYQVIDSYRALDRAKKEYPFTKADIMGQPLGVLGVQVEGGLKGIVVWNKRENGLDYWRSGNGVLVVMREGRLVKTSGFPTDLLASRLLAGVDPLGTPLDRTRSYEFRRELDYLPNQYGVEAVHRLSYVGETTISIFDEKKPVSEWRETVRLPAKRRSYEQIIQVDPVSGRLMSSSQHVGERMSVRFELLKLPESPAP